MMGRSGCLLEAIRRSCSPNPGRPMAARSASIAATGDLLMALSYESSGVRYDQLDAFKRACQQAARTTAAALETHGYAEPATTRGESAYLIEAADLLSRDMSRRDSGRRTSGRRGLRGDRQMFLSRNRHRYGCDDRQRSHHLRRAADLRRDARRGRRLRLVRRRHPHERAGRGFRRGLPHGRRGVGRGRDADARRWGRTRGHCARSSGHRENSRRNISVSPGMCTTAM